MNSRLFPEDFHLERHPSYQDINTDRQERKKPMDSMEQWPSAPKVKARHWRLVESGSTLPRTFAEAVGNVLVLAQQFIELDLPPSGYALSEDKSENSFPQPYWEFRDRPYGTDTEYRLPCPRLESVWQKEKIITQIVEDILITRPQAECVLDTRPEKMTFAITTAPVSKYSASPGIAQLQMLRHHTHLSTPWIAHEIPEITLQEPNLMLLHLVDTEAQLNGYSPAEFFLDFSYDIRILEANIRSEKTPEVAVEHTTSPSSPLKKLVQYCIDALQR